MDQNFTYRPSPTALLDPCRDSIFKKLFTDNCNKVCGDRRQMDEFGQTGQHQATYQRNRQADQIDFHEKFAFFCK